MSANSQSIATEAQPGPSQTREMSRLDRWLLAPLRFLLAMVAAQTVVGAIVLLGYVYRRMQAHTIAVWTGKPFQVPRWLFAERESTGIGRYTGSLWQHIRTGCAATLALAALALPSGVMMSLSWYAGWNNSFFKGYEYAAVGPLLGVFGVTLGLLTMSYLPYAQARHALTGEWRLFFSWRQNLLLIGMSPLANLRLPLVYAAAGLCIAGARGLLTFAPNIPAFPGLEQDPDGFMASWFFFWAVPFIVLLYSAKKMAARLYADAVIKALQERRIAHGELHDAERYYIRGTLGVANATEPRTRWAVSVRALWPLAFWLPLFAFVYVQQFVNFIGAWGWLNHPLMWLPVLPYAL